MSQIERMTTPTSPVAAPLRVDAVEVARDAMALTKPGIVRLVTMTAGVGFVLAAIGRNWTGMGEIVWAAAWCLAGTALSAAGANALNQTHEWRRDLLMERTRGRPVPAGRLSERRATVLGWVLACVGVGVLWLGVGLPAALVSAVTIGSYLWCYTPLKPVTPLSTVVGAVPGALPPLIGWAAASAAPWRSLMEAGGWSVVAIIFVWQIPHFLAIAWRYREDYARGGHRVLPVLDAHGGRTARAVLVWSVALVPVSLAPIWAMPDHVGLVYGVVAVVGGIGLLAIAVRLSVRRTAPAALALFIGSIVYLPVLLMVLVADALWLRVGA